MHNGPVISSDSVDMSHLQSLKWDVTQTEEGVSLELVGINEYIMSDDEKMSRDEVQEMLDIVGPAVHKCLDEIDVAAGNLRNLLPDGEVHKAISVAIIGAAAQRWSTEKGITVWVIRPHDSSTEILPEVEQIEDDGKTRKQGYVKTKTGGKTRWMPDRKKKK